MKTLKTIQTLSKIGRILSVIVFIFAVVGAALCVAGIISLALIPEGFKIGGTTIHGLIEDKAGIGKGTLYAALISGVFISAGEAVLAKMAELYFRHELEAGTPFTFDGAKKLIRLGIFTICVPVITAAITAVVYAIMTLFYANVKDPSDTVSVSIGLGVMFIITGLICRHGAEVIAPQGDRPER